MPGPDPQALWRENGIEGRQQGWQVGQRLSHTHKYEVINSSSGFPSRQKDLTDNLTRRQVPFQTVQTTCAKFASQCTAHLGGYTKCQPGSPDSLGPLRGSNEHTLNQLLIPQFPENLLGCITRALHLYRLHR